jgi:hypothetical protein
MPNTESKHGGKKKKRTGGKIKQSKYCKLMQYINDRSPELGEVFERLCITSDLMPRHGENGVTLLYPKDDSYRKDIIKAMESGDEEGALKMVRSLIIPDYLRDLAEFKRKAVGNRLGVAFTVESASTSGAKIAPDVELETSDFKWLKKFDKQEQNVNVFTVKKGRLPTEGKDKYAAPLRPKRTAMNKEMKKVGGNNPRIKERVIKGLVDAIMIGKDTEFACSLLVQIKQRDPARFKAVLPLLNWEPAVTVITLLNCDMADLIPEELGTFGTAKKYVELLNSGSGMNGTISGSQILTAQKNVRNGLRDASAVDIIPKIDAAYEALLKGGTIAGVGKALPDETLSLLGTTARKKWLDEMAYMVGTAMNIVRTDPRSDRNMLEQLFMTYWCGPASGTNYDSELYLMSKSVLLGSVDRQSNFNVLMRFIGSSAFLHVLLPMDVASASAGTMHSIPPAYYNIEADACVKINSSASINQAAPSIAEVIAAEWSPAAKP